MDKALMTDTLTRNCPENLRPAVDAWLAGRLTGEALEEASFRAALDFLPAYEWQPAPFVPDGVELMESLTLVERSKLTPTDWRIYYAAQEGYFHAVAERRCANDSNRAWLSKLLAWAQTKDFPESVVERIRHTINTHASRA